MRLRCVVGVSGGGGVHVFGPQAQAVHPGVVPGRGLRGHCVHVAIQQAVGRLGLQQLCAQH